MMSRPASKPHELPIDLIDEDPDQPRREDNPGFAAESIAEIGQTIKDRGVKSPISVRENPLAPGRYIINHGARRYRGSKWAGKTTIPAFIDNDYSQSDQVIENLHRNELTSREIADYIGRELAKGKTQREIAAEIGKSRPYVSLHATLLDLPEPVAEAFNRGRVRDVIIINEMVAAWRESPNALCAWLSNERQEITRASIRMLRAFINGNSAGADLMAVAPALDVMPVPVSVPAPAPVSVPAFVPAPTHVPTPEPPRREDLGERSRKGGRVAQMEGARQVNVYLDAESIEAAKAIGHGNVSDGIRRALKMARNR